MKDREPGRSWAPVVMLVLVSPLLLEFLSGDVTLSAAPALLGFACLNGAGAVLLRELAVRRGSVATLLLGAVAFGVWEEGVLDQSLFDPNGFGPGWLAYGYLPAIGTSPPIVIFEVTVDAVFSVLVPVGLTHLAFPQHRARQWLGRGGLVVFGVLFALGCTATVAVTAARVGWLVSGPELLVSLAVVAALLSAAALARPVHTRSERAGAFLATLPPALMAGLTLAASSALLLLIHTRYDLGLAPWAMTVVLLALAAGATSLLLTWRRDPRWTPTRQFAVCVGAVLTYAWFGLYRRLADTPVHTGEQIVLVAAAITALIILYRRLRAPRSAAVVATTATG